MGAVFVQTVKKDKKRKKERKKEEKKTSELGFNL